MICTGILYLPRDALEFLLVAQHCLVRGQQDLKLGVPPGGLPLTIEEELMLTNGLAILAAAAVLHHVLQYIGFILSQPNLLA